MGDESLTIDPARAAWMAAGRPAAATTRTDKCARCSRLEPTVPVRQVVSDRFTGRDEWLHPHGDGLCSACTWLYRSPQLRQQPHLIHRTPPRLRPLSLPALRSALAVGIDPAQALSVVLRAGRKHSLPAARWGQLCIDGVSMPWSDADRERLEVMARLRGRRIPAAAFSAQAPPYAAVRRLDPAERLASMQDWQVLQPWRERPPYLAVGLLATTTSTRTSQIASPRPPRRQEP